jgi:YVTN family beta-propeller protein
MRASPRAFIALLALIVGGSLGPATAEPTVVETIFVGHGVEEVAVNPLTDRAFVTNPPSRYVGVVDLTVNAVIDNFGFFPLFPEDVTVDCLNNRIHVAARVRFHHPDLGLVIAVDGDSGEIIGLAPIGAGRADPVFDPFANRVYAIASRTPGMVVLEGGSSTVIDRVHGPQCRAIGVDPLAGRIHVSDQADLVMTFDTDYHPTAAPVGVNDGRRLAVDAPGGGVYVTQYSQDRLAVIDGATHESAGIPVGDAPLGVAVNPLSGRTYVANHRGGTVSVIDDGAVVATVPVGRQPTSVAVNPLTELVYVVNSRDGTVSVISDLDPEAPPRRVLSDLITLLMVEAGGASGRVQDALGFVEAGVYDAAAGSLLAFSEEIGDQTLSPQRGEKLAMAARRVLVMMIGN